MSFCLRYSVALGDPAQPGREPTEISMNGGHGNYYLLRRVIFGLQSPSSSPCPTGELAPEVRSLIAAHNLQGF